MPRSLTGSTIDYPCSLSIMSSNYCEAEKPPDLIITGKNLHVRNRPLCLCVHNHCSLHTQLIGTMWR